MFDPVSDSDLLRHLFGSRDHSEPEYIERTIIIQYVTGNLRFGSSQIRHIAPHILDFASKSSVRTAGSQKKNMETTAEMDV